MIWGLGSSIRLLIPAGLLEQLDAEQWATILVHELAHLRRRDHWVRVVELLASGLYWWHPVVWWARHALHEAEEQCCDAWVVELLAGAARSYATALLVTAAFLSKVRSPLPATASGIGPVSHLRRRLMMIMSMRTPRSLSWAAVLGLMGLAFVLLPLSPGQAQPTPQPSNPTADQPPNKGEDVNRLLYIKQVVQAAEQEEQSAVRDMAADSAELDRAKQEVATTAAQLENLRAQLKAAEARHHQAMDRLKKLSASLRNRQPDRPGTPKGPGEERPAQPSGSLEMRLDRLQKELDALRKEMQSQHKEIEGVKQREQEAFREFKTKQREMELTRQRELDTGKALKEAEAKRRGEMEATRQREAEAKRHEMEAARQRKLEATKQHEMEMTKQRELEAAKRELDAAKQREMEATKQRDRLQKELENLRKEMRRQQQGQSPESLPR
jgi:hypothetical protein